MNQFKEQIIIVTKDLLSQIPFNTIYDYADIFFDMPPSTVSDKETLKNQINFLKKTKLSDIGYEKIDAIDFFLICNKKTNESIQFSNRSPTKGEFRASKLRFFLNMEKINNPWQSLYEVITKGIRNLKYSDRVSILKTTVSGESAQAFFDESIAENHFELYILLVMHLFNKKIIRGEINSLSSLDEKWAGIDLKLILEKTEILAKQGIIELLKIIESMIIHFSGPGNHPLHAKEISEALNNEVINALAEYMITENKLNLNTRIHFAINRTKIGLNSDPHLLTLFYKLDYAFRRFRNTLAGINSTMQVNKLINQVRFEREETNDQCMLFSLLMGSDN